MLYKTFMPYMVLAVVCSQLINHYGIPYVTHVVAFKVWWTENPNYTELGSHLVASVQVMSWFPVICKREFVYVSLQGFT